MKIIVLVHDQLIPPDDFDKDKLEGQPFETEYHVVKTLKQLKHDVKVVGLSNDLTVLREAVTEFQPNIVFNLLEEFAGEATFDHYIVSYLEMLGIKYSGCNPRGLMLARDKALAKKILKYHRIQTPDFLVFRKHQSIRIPAKVQYPLFVKTLNEEASLGISQDSIVNNKEQLKKRVEYLFETFQVDVIAESFIKGREFYVGVMGNSQLKVFPTWELFFDNVSENNPKVATSTVKWNLKYRKKMGIHTGPAVDLTEQQKKQITSVCKRAFRSLEMSGYARMDLRLDPDRGFYLIEANPNPDIGKNDDFAASAVKAGVNYKPLLQKILNLGLRW